MTIECDAILVLTTVQKAWLGFTVPVRADGVVGVAGFPEGGASANKMSVKLVVCFSFMLRVYLEASSFVNIAQGIHWSGLERRERGKEEGSEGRRRRKRGRERERERERSTSVGKIILKL